MNKNKIKNQLKDRRKKRVRAKVSGTARRPRLSVFRSLTSISVQLIDDSVSKTLLSVTEKEIKDGKTRIEKANAIGKLLAEKALAKGIKEVVFDKGSYKFFGRVQAVADGAKEGGLKI